jgi:hypothetical protein
MRDAGGGLVKASPLRALPAERKNPAARAARRDSFF